MGWKFKTLEHLYYSAFVWTVECDVGTVDKQYSKHDLPVQIQNKNTLDTQPHKCKQTMNLKKDKNCS